MRVVGGIFFVPASKDTFDLTATISASYIFILSIMHPNVSSILFVSQGEASLTPRRAVNQKNRGQSSAFVSFLRTMNSHQLSGLRQTLPPVRVRQEHAYEAEDTEMVSNAPEDS